MYLTLNLENFRLYGYSNIRNPLLRFGNKSFWGEKSCLVQWSYEDIEFMKEFDKDDAYNSIKRLNLQGDDGLLRIKHFDEVLEKFMGGSVYQEGI